MAVINPVIMQTPRTVQHSPTDVVCVSVIAPDYCNPPEPPPPFPEVEEGQGFPIGITTS